MASLENKTDRCMYRQWDYDYKLYGETIRKCRRIRDLTQEQVAKEVGVARSTIWKMEHGGYVNPLTIFKVSAFLNVDFMSFNKDPGSEEKRTREEM